MLYYYGKGNNKLNRKLNIYIHKLSIVEQVALNKSSLLLKIQK